MKITAFNIGNQAKLLLVFIILQLTATSCTFSGRIKDKSGNPIDFITGTADLNKVKDVHIINMIRAIGAPNNVITVGQYKYYQWQHNSSVGVSTFLGGGSASLYCSLTVETQANKIKLMTWYGNRCLIFTEPIQNYFKDKFNIAVITEDDVKKPNIETKIKPKAIEAKTTAIEDSSNNQNNIKPSVDSAIDLKQKSPDLN